MERKAKTQQFCTTDQRKCELYQVYVALSLRVAFDWINNPSNLFNTQSLKVRYSPVWVNFEQNQNICTHHPFRFFQQYIRHKDGGGRLKILYHLSRKYMKTHWMTIDSTKEIGNFMIPSLNQFQKHLKYNCNYLKSKETRCLFCNLIRYIFN